MNTTNNSVSNSNFSSPYGPEFSNPIPNSSLNPILMSDSYKISQQDMYDSNGHTLVGSYAHITPRANGKGPDYVIAVGQQHIAATIASLTVLYEHIREAHDFSSAHFGPGVFDTSMFERIALNGGKIPFRIRGVREGVKLPRGVSPFIVESTSEPKAVAYFEAQLQRIWYLMTVATRATEYRVIVDEFLRLTVDLELIELIRPYTIHDFGARSTTSEESAKIGGLAALEAGIGGSDTLAGMLYAMQLMPDLDPTTGKPMMPAVSVPAGEHNVAMSWGEEKELVPFEHAVDRYPTGILSWPIDTYDTLRFVDSVTKPGTLRSRLMARKGKLVLRPDSPLVHPSGRKMTHGETIRAIFARVRENLSDLDASTGGLKTNGKGFLVFPDWLGCIYGDSVTTEDVRDIYTNLVADNWSAQNIVFGVGGNLLQKGIERGTLDFAMKCSQQVYRNDATGELDVRDVGKKTPGKVSPVGRFKVVLREGRYQMVAEDDGPEPDIMVTYYEDGKLYNFDSLATIRARVRAGLGF